jgi:hypothetical protein
VGPSPPATLAPALSDVLGETDLADWAAVVQRALADMAATPAPALALAGEERLPVDVGATPAATESAPPPPPDLDELADQVYHLIRRRLIIEQERNWT